jgi:hypothetical protein
MKSENKKNKKKKQMNGGYWLGPFLSTPLPTSQPPPTLSLSVLSPRPHSPPTVNPQPHSKTIFSLLFQCL